MNISFPFPGMGCMVVTCLVFAEFSRVGCIRFHDNCFEESKPVLFYILDCHSVICFLIWIFGRLEHRFQSLIKFRLDF
jgi:hypothetical protein